MASSLDMFEVNKKLWLSHNRVERMISSFPPELMTPGRFRLDNYQVELMEIHDKFTEFSVLGLAFFRSFLNTEDPPNTTEGMIKNVSWWKTAKNNLQYKVDNHQL